MCTQDIDKTSELFDAVLKVSAIGDVPLGNHIVCKHRDDVSGVGSKAFAKPVKDIRGSDSPECGTQGATLPDPASSIALRLAVAWCEGGGMCAWL